MLPFCMFFVFFYLINIVSLQFMSITKKVKSWINITNLSQHIYTSQHSLSKILSKMIPSTYWCIHLYIVLQNKVKVPECRWRPLQTSLYVWEHTEEWRAVKSMSTCYYVEIAVIPKPVMCLRTKALYRCTLMLVCELRSIPVFVHYSIER